MNERILGIENFIFVIEDDHNEIFGYYFQLKNKEKSFEFNLQSNGRLPKPMKFEIKNLNENGIDLFDKLHWTLIMLGDIILMKENIKEQSCCIQIEMNFDYHGIEKAICGKTDHSEISPGLKDNSFIPKRICVIQMK